MKKLSILSVLGFGMICSFVNNAAFANAPGVRVHCRNVMISHPYVEINGLVNMNTSGPSTTVNGNLRVSLQDTTNIKTISVAGYYLNDGSNENMDLVSRSASDIRSIFMNFKAGLHSAQSYVELWNGAWLRMGCEIR
jgi:hypothetical protein